MNPSPVSCKQHEIKYDYLRALSVLAIIMFHAIPLEPANAFQWWFSSFMRPLLQSFVGIYFMLSGVFLLNNGTENIPRFYYRRFRSVGIPLIVYALIYYGYDAAARHTHGSIARHGAVFLYDLLTAAIPGGGHLWFMYVLAAFYICAPFLARMLKSLTDREMAVYLILMAAVQGIMAWGQLLGIRLEPSLQYVIFTGWVYYFVLGYGLKRLCAKRWYPLFAWAGAASVIAAAVLQKLFLDKAPDNPHMAPTVVLMCAAIFLFFEFYGERTWRLAGHGASLVSRYSYSIYLIHFLIQQFYVMPVLLPDMIRRHYLAGILCNTMITFILSFLIAVALDNTIIRLARLCLDRTAPRGGTGN